MDANKIISSAFDKLENRIWKDVPNYEGYYQVSNMGEVRSVDRYVSEKKFLYGAMLNPMLDSKGYYNVRLYKNSKWKNLKVHQVMAVAFLGHKINKYSMVINHIDNVRGNNNLSNIEIVTQRYNATHLLNKDKMTSKHTGVSFCKKRKVYETYIHIDYKKVNLGIYKDEEYASLFYKTAVKFLDKYNGDNNEFRNLIKSKI